MFSRESNSSKVALAALVRKLREWDFGLLDCQMRTRHLMQFGAREIPGSEFHKLLAINLARPTKTGKWKI
jgi:leucyl/phenylalanyl-tRNA--protein transferase